MSYKCREEIVGKRFLSVSGFTKLKNGKVSEWGWRAGVVRAATHKDNNNPDLQVLVEFDDVEWHRREWISIYKDGIFHLFMVEQDLIWAERKDPFSASANPSTVLWPALTFSALVSNVEISPQLQPVEFLYDHELAFKDYKLLKPFQEWDPSLPGVREYPEVKTAVRRWAEQQDGQKILLTTPSVLVGYRVEVYRAEGTTQWYTAVIVGYNEATRDLTVTDDTVLEEHNEDPTLVQMRLIGDGVVESIMKGEDVGITPRRSRSTVLQTNQHQQLHNSRVVRGLSSVTLNSSTGGSSASGGTASVNGRKPRSGKPTAVAIAATNTAANQQDQRTSPDPTTDKGSGAKSKKRKQTETETPSTRSRNNYSHIKEDLENQKSRKKNLGRGLNKKKVLEEANNSKLREVEIRVEDCLQNASALSVLCRRNLKQEEEESSEKSVDEVVSSPSPGEVQAKEESKEERVSEDDGSSVELVPVVQVQKNEECVQMPVSEASPVNCEVVSEEDDCVIVAGKDLQQEQQKEVVKSKAPTECSIRVDDDGGSTAVSSLQLFSGNRMDLGDPLVNATSGTASLLHLHQLRNIPDDRSDSGVSSLRSGSGDERSGSRSSALSSTDEPLPIVNTPHCGSASSASSTSSQQSHSSANRSPLFTHGVGVGVGSPIDQVRVWRDPNLLLESEPHVRHINSSKSLAAKLFKSVQHQSLLMSHPSAPAATGPPQTSSAAASHQAASLYPPTGPNLMSPHTHPSMHLPMAPMYLDIWKQHQRYASLPGAGHILTSQAHTEELMDRERERVLHDRERMLRERQSQEMEKQKEKERLERDRLERQEREKHEREKQEKERQNQALQNHFEKSLRVAEQKRGEQQWASALSGRPPRTSSLSEDDRKREQDLHQRHLSASLRADSRDHRSPYYPNVQRPPSVPGKTEYPPPPAHSRCSTSKADKIHPTMQKSDLSMYPYPTHQQFFEPKNKADHHKSSQPSGLVVTKSGGGPLDRDGLPNPPPLVSEVKTVIVKHDGKNPHHLDQRGSIAHSPSPKLRNDVMGHYMPSSGQAPKTIYDYRSQSQSPHHLSHTPSPHHHSEPQNLGKSQGHHRSSGQLSSPHQTQRHSPHPHAQQHASPDMRYRSTSESQALIYPTSAKPSNYSTFLSATTTAYTLAQATAVNSKPKVSSPAPHHFYGKPQVPQVTRVHEVHSNPIQLTAKPPLSSAVSSSPYQQVSQYHPPHPQQTPPMNCLPPPAHSSRTTSSIDRYDNRHYSPGSTPGVLSVKLTGQHGTSPPTAASAPLPVSRSHPAYISGVTLPSLQNIPGAPSVQTQPLDLGVSNKYEPSVSPKRKGTPVSSGGGSPVCLEKRRKLDTPSPGLQQNLTIFNSSGQQPQLSRVSEPSPLIASAATTITTVVNTAAYRTPPTTTVTLQQSPTMLTNNLPADISVTAVSLPVPMEAARPGSTESSQRPPSVPQSISPAPVNTASTTPAPDESPSTPVKTPLPPSSVDSEKSNSPGPTKTPSGGSYPVRHLKKAWLQRHTGEDLEDTTGIIGSGSCVTLPINIKQPSATPSKENPVNSIHSIGSMAVNSISKPKHFNKGVNRKTAKEPIVNGHPAEVNKGDDSSSSDQERGRKSPPKRKPPKVKRKKGGGSASKKVVDEKKRKTGGNQSAVASESGSDSDKESGSEKDSDSGASTTVASGGAGGSSGKKSANLTNAGKEPRKRGRRPKSSKNDKGEEPRPKKSKDDSLPQRDSFRKPPVGQLKKTGESFLQDGPCFEVAPKLAKCRECRWTSNQRSKNMPNIFCRFYAFRRLRYTKNGQLAIAGFSDPHKDALEHDVKLWLPNSESPPIDLDLETSRFLLKQVGDHFCDLLVQEKEAHAEHMSDDKTIAWKRVVQGVREMCDVCETTIFNFHWACGKCGFVVCLDCYKSRKCGTIKIWGEPGKDKDEFSWLLCTNRSAHEQEKLILTQIIAGDSLVKLGKKVHEMRELWQIEQYCGCQTSKDVCQKPNNVAFKEIVNGILSDKMNGIKKEIKEEDGKTLNGIKEERTSPLSWLADVALSNEDKKNDESSSDSEDGNFSTLRELLIRPSHKPNGSRATSPVGQQKNTKKSNPKGDTLDDVISSVIEDSVSKAVENSGERKSELKHFIRRYNWQSKGRAPIPIRIMTLTESQILYPNVPHSWLCDGKLLRLSDAIHKENYKIFQDQWKRGQPVIVSDVTKNLDKNLWNPDAFARDFGDDKNDLINCMTGNLVPNQPMKKFWEGFDHFSKRLKDDRGNPMLLKLKDWPPGEDFAEMLPTRYNDLMKVLPLAEYTHRTGRLNLASRLPECFVRPDLGPKMYNAYGSALHPSKGTTNLHLDISDAVNVMVYVGIPKDGDSDEHIKEAFRAIDEAGCDILTRRRVRDKGELPGALWHIYNARDADKIRDLLNKVVVEKGGRLEPHHDPIHDQSCYLDGPLRERLYKEYGVEGYAIVQCLGDAVFIPAGAPHQVRNLHNCIKVAEDFVSPENVSHCFHLTQEFRDLTDTHSNHEDKLQIKNIIYHAVKDSLSSLSAILNKHVNVKSEDSSERNGGVASDSQNSSSRDASEPA